MGLSSREDHVILDWVILAWYHRVQDRQTVRQTDGFIIANTGAASPDSLFMGPTCKQREGRWREGILPTQTFWLCAPCDWTTQILVATPLWLNWSGNFKYIYMTLFAFYSLATKVLAMLYLHTFIICFSIVTVLDLITCNISGCRKKISRKKL